jgi:hypothetical protein
MLFKSSLHAPIVRGEVTCTVRIWLRPRVRVGGRYRLSAGCVEVCSIQEIGFEALTPALARRCGFASLVEMLKIAKHGAGERVFLIDFRYHAEPVASASKSDTVPDAARLAELLAKLEAMDRRVGTPWTHATLQAIAASPGERAANLAARLGRARDDFKQDVRKLKALGLTVSLEVGYRLSQCGASVLAGARRAGRKPRFRS